MFGKRRYIFTKKKHPQKAIASTILGTISLVSYVLVIYLSFQRGGQAAESYGATGLLITLFAFAGLILGIWSRTEKDMFYFFSWVGILFNTLALGGISLLLYAPSMSFFAP